ncbi:MAG: hypothetical protein VYD45_11465 [Pseudomonadota bacterium]|nr:hypothetical protein [Pseudomonadota bacterium]
MISFTREEAELMRQWFNAAQDLNPGYLELADYSLAAKIHEALGVRVPNSISTHLSNISATSPAQPSKHGL